MESKAEEDRSIPASVVRRLTRYLTNVQQLMAGGSVWISSRDLAEGLGLTSSTVRQDLSHLDFSGVSKRGYEVARLYKVLTDILGADKEWRTVVIGAGNLGKAIALHGEMARRGFAISAIFDADRRKVGRKEGHLRILHVDDIQRVVRRSRVDIGIIAVPSHAAQEVANMLVKAGVKGLLNLSLTHIIVPPGVSVTDVRIVSSLLELTHSIMNRAKSGS